MQNFREMFRFLVVVTLLCFVESDHEAKWYEVDLDQPAEQRWNHVIKDYQRLLYEMEKTLSSYIPKYIRPLVVKLAGDLNHYIEEPFASEMKGIAKYMNVDVGSLVIANILYDVSAFCTSIVVEDSRGQIWLARNMDYDLTPLLRNLTVGVHFTRSGKTIYSATTFAGFIGILTGQRPHSFTISLNERKEGALWMNVLMALLDRKAKLHSFLIRQTLEEEDNFKSAVKRLSCTPTIAGAYLTVGGMKKGEGAVITKSRLSAADIWYLDPTHGRWYLVETNYDHWKPPPPSDDRRTPAMKAMNTTGQDNISAETLYEVLSIPPVLQSISVYTTVMSAAQPQLYQNWIRDNKTDKKAGS